MKQKLKYFSCLFLLLFFFMQPAMAKANMPSAFSNPLVTTLVIIMLILLVIIGILSNMLLQVAKNNSKKAVEERSNSTARFIPFIIVPLLFVSQAVMAQTSGAGTATIASTSVKFIDGISTVTFYLMTGVLVLELIVILAMLLKIRSLLNNEDRLVVEEEPEVVAFKKANQLTWWDKINSLRPVSQEAELDLGHEYDGIRELNNRLPPWWLYGFYITILVGVIYLWRFHVSHNGLSSKEEYETAVAKAEMETKEYLRMKGESVDENTVTFLKSTDDLAAGKALFTDASKCVACHNADGGGNAVGPNLTDDYWLYGGSVKDIFKTIKYGTTKGMRSWKDDLSAKQIAQLASYIKSIRGSKPANAKEPQGDLYKEDNNANLPAADSTSATEEGKKIAMR